MNCTADLDSRTYGPYLNHNVGLLDYSMAKIFELAYSAPLSSRVHSRDACTYLYRAMKLLGWIPPERGRERYLYLLWTGFVFGICFIYIPFGFSLNLYIDFKNFGPGDFLYILQTMINAIGAMFKFLCGIVSLSRQHNTQLLLDQSEKTMGTERDRQKIHNAVAVSNKIFLIYGLCYFAYSISGLLAGVISGQPPWMIYNPVFDWRHGKFHFWMHLIFEYTCGSIGVCSVLVWDSYTLIYVNIFRAHIDVLKDHIRNLRTDSLKTESENYDELIGTIKEHKLILE